MLTNYDHLFLLAKVVGSSQVQTPEVLEVKKAQQEAKIAMEKLENALKSIHNVPEVFNRCDCYTRRGIEHLD